MKKHYLGDSVYADLNENNQLVLTTENGYGPSNTIYLEDWVFRMLTQYVKDIEGFVDDRVIDPVASSE